MYAWRGGWGTGVQQMGHERTAGVRAVHPGVWIGGADQVRNGPVVAADRGADATAGRRGARGLRAAGVSPGGLPAVVLPTGEPSVEDIPAGDLPVVGLPVVGLSVVDLLMVDLPAGESAAGVLPVVGLPADDLAAAGLPAGDLPTAVSVARAAAVRGCFADPPAGGRGRVTAARTPRTALAPAAGATAQRAVRPGPMRPCQRGERQADHRRHDPGMSAQQHPAVVRGDPQQRCGVQDHGGHEDRECKNQNHPPHAGPALPGRAREGKPGMRITDRATAIPRLRRADGARDVDADGARDLDASGARDVAAGGVRGAGAGEPVTARDGPAAQPGSWPSIRNSSVRAARSRIALAS